MKAFNRRQFLKRGAGVAVIAPAALNTSEKVFANPIIPGNLDNIADGGGVYKRPVKKADLDPSKHFGAVCGFGTKVFLDGVELMYIRNLRHGFSSIDISTFGNEYRQYARGPAYANLSMIWSNKSNEQIKSLQTMQIYKFKIVCKDGYEEEHVVFEKDLLLTSLEMGYPIDDVVCADLRFEEWRNK